VKGNRPENTLLRAERPKVVVRGCTRVDLRGVIWPDGWPYGDALPRSLCTAVDTVPWIP
jgi:hypothetical protein